LIIRITVRTTRIASRPSRIITWLRRIRSHIAIVITCPTTVVVVYTARTVIEVVIYRIRVANCIASVVSTAILYISSALISAIYYYYVIIATVIVIVGIVRNHRAVKTTTPRTVSHSTVTPGIPGIIEATVSPWAVSHTTTPERIVEAIGIVTHTTPAPSGIHSPVRVTPAPASTDADSDARTNTPEGSRTERGVIRTPERIVKTIAEGGVEAGIVAIPKAGGVAYLRRKIPVHITRTQRVTFFLRIFRIVILVVSHYLVIDGVVFILSVLLLHIVRIDVPLVGIRLVGVISRRAPIGRIAGRLFLVLYLFFIFRRKIQVIRLRCLSVLRLATAPHTG